MTLLELLKVTSGAMHIVIGLAKDEKDVYWPTVTGNEWRWMGLNVNFLDQAQNVGYEKGLSLREVGYIGQFNNSPALRILIK